MVMNVICNIYVADVAPMVTLILIDRAESELILGNNVKSFKCFQ